MFKKIMLVGLCILTASSSQAMLQAVKTGAARGAAIPLLVGVPYVVMQNKGTGFEKLLPAVLAMAAGGALGAIGGGLSYALTNKNASTGAQVQTYANTIISRAKQCGVAAGTLALCGLAGAWLLQTMVPSRGIFNP